MIDKLLHEREDVRIIRCCRKYDLAVAECVLDRLGHILPRKVTDDDLGACLCAELISKQLNRFARVPVNGGVCDEHAVALRLVARPCVVKLNIVTEIFGQDGTMQRADNRNIERGSLLEKRLHLSTVFSDDSDEIAACLIVPGLGNIERAEFTEAVRGEQHLIPAVIGHHDLGPMHHRRKDKGQVMLPEVKHFPVIDNNLSVGNIHIGEIIRDHDKGLVIGNDLGIGIDPHKILDIRRVIRFHMLHYKVIGLPIPEHFGDIVEPFMGKMNIYRIHDGDLLVKNDVGIVAHAVRHDILTFEQVNLVVVDANVSDIVCDFHFFSSVLIIVSS